MENRDASLVSAIDRIGSAAKLATLVGVSPQALSQWRRVPPLRVLDVERVTGVPRHELRPDLYPAPCVPAPTEEAAA
ncbi:DNA-binding transcriptional regulator YdaS (Cro superfamily) [Angulomicrobium tetraedrale]|uniref:DNA-binding transcriptional regulator YdaS (Cro superfamily) n=1 Tax=Ancylobacter tetraedralis TaxID=217068 RepID=A0A839Z9Z0_9HYPH|nr:Cro/CI family transcriptional regulator [Ancylobacter tetraedralis]MBB3771554.1 DNA-binding transcriptional regulator YdaS (Cro superfamily) [Ancylobacter tetraedralis]